MNYNLKGIHFKCTWQSNSNSLRARYFDSAEMARAFFYSKPEHQDPSLYIRFGWNGDEILLLNYNQI